MANSQSNDKKGSPENPQVIKGRTLAKEQCVRLVAEYLHKVDEAKQLVTQDGREEVADVIYDFVGAEIRKEFVK